MKAGGSLPVHHVACLGCGAALERKTWWREPRCTPCSNRHWHKQKAQRLVVIRREARRYRIVLHVLGWEDSQFEEMLLEMKRSPMSFRKRPETRAARRDLLNESRCLARAEVGT